LRIEVASPNKYCHIFLRMRAFDEHLSIFNGSEQYQKSQNGTLFPSGINMPSGVKLLPEA